MTAPRHLLDAWDEIAPRFSRCHVAIFTDFDGTLAPIARRPSAGHLAPGLRPLLAQAARHGVLVGVISGRRLPDLKARVGVPGLWYAGEHGHFFLAPDGRTFTLGWASELERIARVRRRVCRALGSERGILVEPKAATVAIHYRNASLASAHRAGRVVAAIMADEPGLRLFEGKKIFELVAAGSVDKWAAVQFIRRRDGRKFRTVVFLGDDSSDEAVFRGMRGAFSVFVGRRGTPTAARFWLRSPAEVREFLSRCVRLWQSPKR